MLENFMVLDEYWGTRDFNYEEYEEYQAEMRR